MQENNNAKRRQPAASELSRMDMICDRFEAAWSSGRPPEIEPYLADVPEPLRSRLRRELEAISAERKGRRGGAMNLERFGRLLLRSGLMSAEELASFQAELGGSPNAEDLARALVRARKLTKYQAQEVWQGHGDGLILGEYVILDEIGAGGMGKVLKARHRRMERIVALKVLSSKLVGSPEALKRFHREVKAAARLEHPNIVTAYDAGESNGTHYLVMQYVRGTDLSQILKQNGPLTVEQAVDCTIQAARGLEYAHQQGVIHRDIKPGNLLLDDQGAVKILDMGLARIERQLGGDTAGPADASEKLTSTGMAMGTCDYMAPEQAEDTHAADGRADIYSLGCTLYRLLTGKPPYPSDTPVKVILGHIRDPIPSLRTIRLDVPEELDAVFQKMVAKRPEDRYQSMTTAIEALQASVAPVSDTGRVRAGHDPSDAALTSFLANLGKSATRAAVPPVTEEIVRTRVEQETGIVARITTAMRGRLAKHTAAGGVGILVVVAAAVLFFNRDTNPTVQEFSESGKTDAAVVRPATSFAVMPARIAKAGDRRVPQSADGDTAASIAEASSTGGLDDLLNGWSEPVNLGPQVNSEDTDSAPTLSGDSLTLIFASKRVGGLGDGDLWLCTRQLPEHSFSKPAHMGAEINSIACDSTPALSADGLTLIFYSGRPGGLGKNDLWMCTRKSLHDPFGRADNLGAAVNSTADDGFPAISSDGLTLIFASNRAGGLGAFDLWMSTRVSDTESFGPAVNLGPVVNSGGWEGFPALSADNRHLIFSTDRSGGIGGGDLWISARSSDDAPFGIPRNMGATVNSAEHDGGPCLSRDGTFLLFHSQRPGGLGDIDLWMSTRKSLTQPTSELEKPGQPPPAVAPFDAAQAKKHQQAWADYLGVPVEVTNSIGMKLVLIPPGEFDMGSTEEEVECDWESAMRRGDRAVIRFLQEHLPSQTPRHHVQISRAFYLCFTEVTQEQYERVMGTNPSKFVGDPKRPVESVSWDDAAEFCVRLSDKDGKVYRLPTEAEWEYACRAGSVTKWSFGDSESGLNQYAWYTDCSGGTTHPVAGRKPNAWGLYDMHGSLWEWCADWCGEAYYSSSPAVDPLGPFVGESRVLRAGAWSSVAAFTGSAIRSWGLPQQSFANSGTGSTIGFRVARAPWRMHILAAGFCRRQSDALYRKLGLPGNLQGQRKRRDENGME